jgi:hypothetical protein
MVSVELHTQVYREQYADMVRTAQHDQMVRQAAPRRQAAQASTVTGWMRRHLARPTAPAATVCCAAACC